MRLAFVLLTFKDVEQIERLVGALVRGTSDRLIVVCHSGNELDRARIRAMAGVDHVIDSPGGRASFGVIDGLISGMRWLERQPKSYGWVSVLSGQDYPVRPLADLERELLTSPHDGYFFHFDVHNAAESAAAPMQWSEAEITNRYHFRYAILKPESTTLERALLKLPRLLSERSRGFRLHTSYGIRLGQRHETLPLPAGYRLFGGNFWMTMSHRAVQTVLDFYDANPRTIAYYRGTIVPEESFVATVLANARDISLTRRELRFVEYGQLRHGYVRPLDLADLDRVAASGCFIARKFDLRATPGILDEVDRRIEAAAIRPHAA